MIYNRRRIIAWKRGSSVCGISGFKPGGRKSKKGACHRCNTKEHSEQGFFEDVRKKLRRTYKAKCEKCFQTGRFTDCCHPPKGAGGKKREPKKAKVNAVSAEKAEPETQESAVVDAPAAPAGGSPGCYSEFGATSVGV